MILNFYLSSEIDFKVSNLLSIRIIDSWRGINNTEVSGYAPCIFFIASIYLSWRASSHFFNDRIEPSTNSIIVMTAHTVQLFEIMLYIVTNANATSSRIFLVLLLFSIIINQRFL